MSTKWFHNGKELSGMDHREVIQVGKVHKLHIKRTKTMDEGNYECRVKDQKTQATVKIHRKILTNLDATILVVQTTDMNETYVTFIYFQPGNPNSYVGCKTSKLPNGKLPFWKLKLRPIRRMCPGTKMAND